MRFNWFINNILILKCFLSEDVLLMRLILCINIEMFFSFVFVFYYLFNVCCSCSSWVDQDILYVLVIFLLYESISTSKFDFLLIDDVMVLQWYFHGLKGIDYKYQEITIST